MPAPPPHAVPPLDSTTRAWYGLGQVTGRSMTADVTDEDLLLHGRRREGVFFGAVSFSAKASFGVGSQIAGFVVDAVGLQPNQAPETAGPAIVQGLGLTLGISTLLLCGLSIGFFLRYGISRVRHGEIQAALAARGAAAGGSDGQGA